jgi:hypothetical protein
MERSSTMSMGISSIKLYFSCIFGFPCFLFLGILCL